MTKSGYGMDFSLLLGKSQASLVDKTPGRGLLAVESILEDLS